MIRTILFVALLIAAAYAYVSNDDGHSFTYTPSYKVPG